MSSRAEGEIVLADNPKLLEATAKVRQYPSEIGALVRIRLFWYNNGNEVFG